MPRTTKYTRDFGKVLRNGVSRKTDTSRSARWNSKENKSRFTDLLEKYERLNEAHKKLEEEYHEYRENAFRIEEEHYHAVLDKEAECEAKLVALKRTHLRSTRISDWGIQPISDDTIASRLAALRDDVAHLARISFKHVPSVASFDLTGEPGMFAS
ncbi:hypothetical protein RUND412_010463 [Rhizina undulata]